MGRERTGTPEDRQAFDQSEASLREQRAELARMMADVRSMHELVRQQQNADVQALLDENAALRRRLSELEEGGAPASAPQDADILKELADLREENRLLRRLLEEKDAAVTELQKNPPAAREADAADIDSIETELNEFRRQLEADRQELDMELHALKIRNEELDEATREMEMELSRERAELARERTRLERLREDVKGDLERLQRDGGVRESLAPVQRLRDEISQRRQPAPAKPAAPPQGDLNDRLRSFRSRLSE